MSDDELAKALATEIGIFGGRSSPDRISLTYQAAGLVKASNEPFIDLLRERHFGV